MRHTDLSGERRLKRLLAVSLLLVFCYYMMWQVNWYLAENVKQSYYVVFVSVVTAAALVFGGLRHGLEYRLVFVYWLWYILTRILCGDPALQYEFLPCLDLALMLPAVLLGLLLDPRERDKFLKLFAGVAGFYYFVLGVIALYTFVRRIVLISPITGGAFGIQHPEHFDRITIMDFNVDSSACWFMMAFLLMVWLFFAVSKKIWRVPIAAAALVDYAVVSITYTRSVRAALSLTLALLAAMLVQTRLKTRKKGLAALVLVLVFLVSAPLLYLSHSLVSGGLSRVSAAVTAPAQTTAQTETASRLREAEPAALVLHIGQETQSGPETPLSSTVQGDTRVWSGNLDEYSTGRISIYKSAFYTLWRKPVIMLRGCLQRDYMDIANEMLVPMTGRAQVHYQNYLLEVMVLTGLPGLALVLILSLLLAIKGLKLCFARCEGLRFADRTLPLGVAAIMLYGMFERCIFTYTDERSLYFYLLMGFMLAAFREHFPEDRPGRGMRAETAEKA